MSRGSGDGRAAAPRFHVPKRTESVRPRWLWWGIRCVLRPLFALYFRYRARGQEHLPQQGGALLIVNHQSYVDPLFVGVPLQRPVSFIARDSLFRVPLLGWLLRETYVMPINRNAATGTTIRQTLQRLDEGFLVGIFPEGTRTQTGEIGRLKPGFIAILKRGEVPVLPVAIAGGFQAMPRGSLLVRPSRVRVVFGEPIDMANLRAGSGRESQADLLKLVETRLRACLAEAEAWRAGMQDESTA